jgi:hypothetical protein
VSVVVVVIVAVVVVGINDGGAGCVCGRFVAGGAGCRRRCRRQ